MQTYIRLYLMNDMTKTAIADTNPINADEKTITSMKMERPSEYCSQVKQLGRHMPEGGCFLKKPSSGSLGAGAAGSVRSSSRSVPNEAVS